MIQTHQQPQRGIRNSRAKERQRQIDFMWHLHLNDVSPREIAKVYGIDVEKVRRELNRKYKSRKV